MEQALRRRLERMREPKVFHNIEANVPTEYPDPEPDEKLESPDVSTRRSRRKSFHRDLRKRIAKKISDGKIRALAGKPPPPTGMSPGTGNRKPGDFPAAPEHSRADRTDADIDSRWPAGKQPEPDAEQSPTHGDESPKEEKPGTIQSGDSLAARARRLKKRKE
jgi:hypothetical protein